MLKDSTNKINSKEIWLDAIGRDVSFLKNRSKDLVKQIYEMPLPFKVYRTADEISLPFNLVWKKAADSLEVVYEVMLSKDFLFPDSTTYKYRTNKHFLTLQDNIPFNKYYWKVLAIKNENSTEGFNSKNKFLLKKGTILPKMIKGDLDLTLDGSPYRVTNNTTIDSLSVVKIMPGVTVLMDENKEILCKGELNILGTKEKKVQIRPTSVNSYFNSIFFYNYSKGNIIHTNILDGLINSKRSNLKIENTNIFIKNRPMETDDKRSSIIWGWYGNMFLNNISLFGNQKGEGINISWASSASISNSSFYNTPDAIELINVNNGLISNNLVYYSADDAIDLNSCSNILIEKNTLINNSDKGISIGVDWGNDFVTEHGRSNNINIINNIILGNNVGVAIKDSSEVYSSNNIISYNNEGLKLYKKQEGYELGGTCYSLNDQIAHNKNNYSEGFTLVEIIIAIGISSLLSGLMFPSFLNLIRTEKVNSYTRELREYFRVIKLDARRWGSSCLIKINEIDHNGVSNDKNYYGYKVTCKDNPTTVNLAPPINNSIFQVVNKDFLITPNGRISSNNAIVIVIGSQYHKAGAKILNCLVIQSPTGHTLKGKFLQSNWITNNMKVSDKDNNNFLSPEKCKFD